MTDFCDCFPVPAILEIKNKKRKAELPPLYHHVLVQCEGFRGLAYRNCAGGWKTVAENRNLPINIEILTFN
jgi:hypothetical protein